MKKGALLVSALFLLPCWIDRSLAQSDTLLPYPASNKIYPVVKAEVAEETPRYVFLYRIGNGQNALQAISDYMLELMDTVDQSSAPVNWRVWIMDYDTIKVVTWFSEDSVADIEPSGVLTGFSIESAGLPKPARCWFRAWETVRGREGQYNPETAGIFVVSLGGTTIGPSHPPRPFAALPFLDTLLSYTRQSAELGWLGRDRDNDCDDDERPDDGLVRNIEKRLDKAKSFLEREDSVKARKELEKLVRKVERVWKRSQDQDKKRDRDREWRQDKSIMTSEAYALLKYNTEYLIDRLPEREKPDRGRDKGKPGRKDRD